MTSNISHYIISKLMSVFHYKPEKLRILKTFEETYCLKIFEETNKKMFKVSRAETYL